MAMFFGALKNRSLLRKDSGGTENSTGPCTLCDLRSGDCGTVQRLEGGEDFRCKMMALGIVPGKTVTVTRGEKHQPYVLRVDDSRVMVDWGTLGRIHVNSGAATERGRGI
jgi:Fe2+ transport system protein FeoA